jgi:hypothetical protein
MYGQQTGHKIHHHCMFLFPVTSDVRVPAPLQGSFLFVPIFCRIIKQWKRKVEGVQCPACTQPCWPVLYWHLPPIMGGWRGQGSTRCPHGWETLEGWTENSRRCRPGVMWSLPAPPLLAEPHFLCHHSRQQFHQLQKFLMELSESTCWKSVKCLS